MTSSTEQALLTELLEEKHKGPRHVLLESKGHAEEPKQAQKSKKLETALPS